MMHLILIISHLNNYPHNYNNNYPHNYNNLDVLSIQKKIQCDYYINQNIINFNSFLT